jgi:uncharacterized Zn finger protein
MSSRHDVTHPRFPARRQVPRPATWWARAWLRAVEEAAYAEGDLRAGRGLARAGRVGQLTTGPGTLLAAVEQGGDAWTVEVRIPTMTPEETGSLVDLVAAEAGRIGALLGGDLPHDLVEHAEEVGVELLPYGAELAAECSCAPMTPPCPHALAVLVQACWLVDRDPVTLLLLRGLPREEMLAELHARASGPEAGGEAGAAGAEADLDVAYDAAVRAARILAGLDEPDTVDHLF